MQRQDNLNYKLVEGWEKLPEGYKHYDVEDVAVDSQDRVFVLTRFDCRIIVYDCDGNFITSFGEDILSPSPHGISIGPDDSVYCVDEGANAVLKFSPDGKLLTTIKSQVTVSEELFDPVKGVSIIGRVDRGGPPFNRPTNVAIAANGDVYVTDGTGNARVHRFSANGKLIQSWGEPGNGPGEFHFPHNVGIAPDGRVFVADRENDRIQIFSPTGEYLDQWTYIQRPNGFFIDKNGLVYVGELWRVVGERSFRLGEIKEDMPGRVTVLDLKGNILARWGGPNRWVPGNFIAPHGICSDSRGDVYVAESPRAFTAYTNMPLPVPLGSHTLQKFELQPSV